MNKELNVGEQKPHSEINLEQLRELKAGVIDFIKKLNDGGFESKFWWHGHDDESGKKEWEKYTSSPEMKELSALYNQATTLGIDTGNRNIMVTRAANHLLLVLEGKEKPENPHNG